MKYTKETLFTAIANERDYTPNIFDSSNKSKHYKTLDILEQIVDTLDDTRDFTIEKAKKDRPFEFFNIGVFGELALRSKLTKTKHLKKAKAKSYDCIIDGIRYEIKSCLGNESKNTTYHGENNILLLNALGVWKLSKEEAISRCDKKGCFKYNAEYNEYDTELSKKLGF